MTRIFRSGRSIPLIALAPLALVACGQAEETTPAYEADVTDLSGGEMIVTQEDPAAAEVVTPDTPMTPVAQESEEAEEAEEAEKAD